MKSRLNAGRLGGTRMALTSLLAVLTCAGAALVAGLPMAQARAAAPAGGAAGAPAENAAAAPAQAAAPAAKAGPADLLKQAMAAVGLGEAAQPETTVGVTTTLPNIGITETVDQIMARDALMSREEKFGDGSLKMFVERELEPLPGARMLPGTPRLSQWPPLDANAAPPAGRGDAERAPQTLGLNFQGYQISETPGFVPPDTMGEVGPTQIMVFINGGIRTYNKSTGAISGLNTTTDNFWTSVRNGSSMSDPRVVYDPITQRWFLIMINTVNNSNRICIAVSSGPSITGTASFTFFGFAHDSISTPAPAPDAGGFWDYPSLGVDANALYIGGNIFGSSQNASLIVVNKAALLTGTVTATAFRGLRSGGNAMGTPMGVSNTDPSATVGFVIADSASAPGSGLEIRRINNPGGTPTITTLPRISTIAYASPAAVPQNGSTATMDAIDTRLFNARMFRDRVNGTWTIWTAHTTRANSSGVGTSGGDRNAGRWYQIGFPGAYASTNPTVTQSGTLFDSAASGFRQYWFPSVAMSGQGHAAVGASFAGSGFFTSIATAGRLRTDALGTLQAPATIVSGTATYAPQGATTNRWGDYTATVLDSSDGQTMWTFQEWANSTNSWAIRVTRLIAPPPATPSSTSPSSTLQGQTLNVVINGTSSGGSEFYDNDSNFPNASRMAVAFSGTGVTVNTVTWNSPTQITANVTVSGSATTGARNITVTNPDGQAITGNSIFTINPAGPGCPQFTTQPSSATACVGGSASFTVAVTGSPTPTLQWQLNGTNIPGATGATYTDANVQPGDAGTYTCVATNSCGTNTSNAVTLTVNTPPSITTQPAGASVCVNGTVTFTVAASGSPAPTFQWRLNGTNIPGATSTSYTDASVQLADAGSYDCVVTNSCTSVTSNAATLSVSGGAPSITLQPNSQTVCAGTAVTFSTAATNSPNFQWRKNSTNIPGATSASYTIASPVSGDSGNYDCVVSNGCASLNTSVATLTVNTAPSISTQPSGATLCEGGTFTVSVVANATPLPTYQWRQNGSNIPGAIGPSYSVGGAAAFDSGTYDCVITNTCGSVTSSGAVVNVTTGPTISNQPSPASACVGGSASFTVVSADATGYQWRRNGTNISGATSATYSIGSVVSGNAGTYDCVLTNTCGTTTSSGVALTVNTAPGITGNPGSISRCVGTPASFTVTATGATGFQWRKNTTNIPGATSATYTIASVVGGDAGGYDCVVSNSCGSTTSSAATLTVTTTPGITGQPGGQTVCTSQPASFTVTATGATGFQWRKNTTNIPGATSATYNIASVVSGDAGSYDCLVSNSCGSVTSNAATLTVNTAPSIGTQPGNTSACVGQPASFTVSAAAATGFQWRKNSSNIPGATSATYTIASVVGGDAGSYDCVVSNSCGSVTSSAATLTVNAAPSIGTQPGNTSACVGGPASFTVAATNATGFQWRKNTTNIPGATSATYTIASVVPGDAGSYDCVVSSSCGSVTSTAATLTVGSGPSISQQPQNTSACLGQPASFTVAASGATGFQWQLNGSNIPGATAATYNIPAVAPGDAGTYDCVISSSCGTVTSQSAQLTINPVPSITGQPSDTTVCPGQPASFTVAASNATGYQWRKGGVNIPGATAATFTIATAAGGDAGTYDCVVSNACGSVFSSVATLAIGSVPSIGTQPGGSTVCEGQPASFSVAASGATGYQWRLNSVNIPGATSATYSIASATGGDAGSYDCVVSNACGSVTSTAATLTVNLGPSVTTQPNGGTVCSSKPFSMTVAASGSGTLTFQWRKNGVNVTNGGTISGATSPTLSWTAVTTADSGSYDCVVTNLCGSASSSAATLSVFRIPGDVDGNGSVGSNDLSILLASFGKCPGDPGYDARANLDSNPCIGSNDLSIILANFGQSCP
ncbi:MAG: immunoglobulin domain-containing protein [Phycisphaerales bacterium]|nr:immunoglobulin domain-containing protein [Phycisphaerales bacterium]